MTKDKSITGGEVDALKRDSWIHWIALVESSDKYKFCQPSMRETIEITIDYLASKGHLKTTGNPSSAIMLIEDHLIACDVMCDEVRDAIALLKTTGEDEKGVDLAALKRELAEIFNEWQDRNVPSFLVQGIVEHLASTGRIMGEWKPISEAPRDGTRVLVWSDELYMKPYIAWWGVDQNAPEDGNEQEEWLTGDGDSWSTGYYYTPCKPTHWMPLPPAPKTDGVQEDLDRSTMERK